MTRLVILGATGSIGRQALDVVAAHPDRFDVVGLAAGSDAAALHKAADATGCTALALANPDAAAELSRTLGVTVRSGQDGVDSLAELDCDIVLNGITGSIGLSATLTALGAGNRVALANKESLVAGGPLVMAAARKLGDVADWIIPVDSEHSGVGQCLRAVTPDDVAAITLTASGGPFRTWTREQIASATPADALNHPTWSMGPVVTINSATLANKALEVIEAAVLFDLAPDAVDAVVHPQSIVHAMVTMHDGSTLAQLAAPDMRLPIQHALTWPRHIAPAPVQTNLAELGTLTFEPIDTDRFPMFVLARQVLAAGPHAGVVFNAANEVAVDAFLDDRISFGAIAETVESALDRTQAVTLADFASVQGLDAETRASVAETLKLRA